MIIQPEKETRNGNDLFYEAESRRIDMLNREFFQNVQFGKNDCLFSCAEGLNGRLTVLFQHLRKRRDSK